MIGRIPQGEPILNLGHSMARSISLTLLDSVEGLDLASTAKKVKLIDSRKFIYLVLPRELRADVIYHIYFGV